MKLKIRSVNLDDETVAKLNRIGIAETGSSNISAAIRVLAKNYKEKK